LTTKEDGKIGSSQDKEKWFTFLTIFKLIGIYSYLSKHSTKFRVVVASCSPEKKPTGIELSSIVEQMMADTAMMEIYITGVVASARG
jgi:hypothetical protein